MQWLHTKLGQFKERTPLVARELKVDMKRDDIPGLGAEIAYHAIFAIPPLVILVVTIAAAINQFTGYALAERLIDTIEENAPNEIRELLITLVENAIENVSGGLASIGVVTAALIAIWSGSNGVAALIKAFNRAYGVVDERSWLRLKSIAIGMTLLVTFMINAAFLLLVFGQDLADWLAEKLNLGNALELTIELVRWPLSVVFIMFVLGLLYYVGPAVDQSFRWISPGSVLATLLWILLVFGFKFYIQYADPGSAYGALGSIVVLMFFLYISAIIFVVGAEINAILGERYDPETIRDLAQNPEKLADPHERPEAVQRGKKRRGRLLPKFQERQADMAEPEPSPGVPVTESPARAGRVIAIAAMAGLALVGLLRRRGSVG